MEDPDLKLREGGGQFCFAYDTGSFSFCEFFLFLPKINGAGPLLRFP